MPDLTRKVSSSRAPIVPCPLEGADSQICSITPPAAQTAAASLHQTRTNDNAAEKRDLEDLGPVESMGTRLNRLGRQRPEVFKSLWAEVGFVFSVVMSQFFIEFLTSGFTIIIPTLSRDLDIPTSGQIWPQGAFSLTAGAFLLPFGRLSDMYGGYPVYVGGMAWLAVWCGVSALAQNQITIDICRAFAGIGPAAFLPSSLMLLGSIYRPGPRKNLIFGIYAALAPFGFFGGIFFAGVTAEFTTWRWFFFIGCMFALLTAVVGFFTIPSDIAERRAMNIKMDWPGAFTTTFGLILVVFAVTEGPHAPNGWGTSYVIVTLILGFLLLGAAVYIEGWHCPHPLLPFDIFKVRYMGTLMFALLFCWGNLGIFILYATFYMQNILHGTPLQLVAWYVPLALGGCIIATCSGFILHRVSTNLIIGLACTCWIIAPLLFALMPEHPNYWAWIFPAMICATTALDTTYNITNVFITTSLPKRHQGVGGALISVLLEFGIALFLGPADNVGTYTADQGLRQSYKNVFWFEVATGAVFFVLMVGFVRIQPARSALTADEIEEQAREALEQEREAAQGVSVEGVRSGAAVDKKEEEEKVERPREAHVSETAREADVTEVEEKETR